MYVSYPLNDPRRFDNTVILPQDTEVRYASAGTEHLEYVVLDKDPATGQRGTEVFPIHKDFLKQERA